MPCVKSGLRVVKAASRFLYTNDSQSNETLGSALAVLIIRPSHQCMISFGNVVVTSEIKVHHP